jgi:UPF0271 protein
MRQAILLAAREGVKIGAHPGLAEERGRGGRITLSESEIIASLEEQLLVLARIAAEEAQRIHHIKLHGTLYHAVEKKKKLREAFLDWMAKEWPQLIVIARSGGTVVAEAQARELTVWEEIFADRAYLPDGQLGPRTELGAVLADADEVAHRLRQWCESGKLPDVNGQPLALTARTCCVHADTPNAIKIAEAAWMVFREAAIL